MPNRMPNCPCSRSGLPAKGRTPISPARIGSASPRSSDRPGVLARSLVMAARPSPLVPRRRTFMGDPPPQFRNGNPAWPIERDALESAEMARAENFRDPDPDDGPRPALGTSRSATHSNFRIGGPADYFFEAGKPRRAARRPPRRAGVRPVPLTSSAADSTSCSTMPDSGGSSSATPRAGPGPRSRRARGSGPNPGRP